MDGVCNEEKEDGETGGAGAVADRATLLGRASPLSSSSSSSTGTPTELTKRHQQLALQRRPGQHQQQQSSQLAHLVADQSATFESLIPPHLLRSVYEMGFNRPSAIQASTLPLILDGRNVIAQAQSGSRKTVAFSLGVLVNVVTSSSPSTMTTQALIVTPTREHAVQVLDQAIRPLSAHMPGLVARLAIAGSDGAASPAGGGAGRAGLHSAQAAVSAHVVIGTPGKVTDWLKRKTLDVRSVRVFVLDEADSMVEGFRAKTLRIYRQHCYECKNDGFELNPSSSSFPGRRLPGSPSSAGIQQPAACG
jgi:superfamily II DNA/RNA helicase